MELAPTVFAGAANAFSYHTSNFASYFLQSNGIGY